MQILLTTLEGAIFPIEVSPELEVINLKALCEQETNIPLSEMSLSHNGKLLSQDSQTLGGYSIKENDIIMVQKLQAQCEFFFKSKIF
jgi:DNA damage-inducible protein 1